MWLIFLSIRLLADRLTTAPPCGHAPARGRGLGLEGGEAVAHIGE
jgi:hypothetical protein